MKERYFELMQNMPELFENPKGCPIQILLTAEEIEKAETVTGRSAGIMYEDGYIYLLRDAVQWGNGSYGTYIRVVHKNQHGGTAVLPVTDEGKIILTRHFRHSTRKFYYEIPRGFLEKGLTKEENARKELKEEINATEAQMHYLGEVLPDGGMIGTSSALFLAKVPACQLKVNDELEGITTILELSCEEITEKILNGEIVDGYTMTALFLAKTKGLL